jgi:hypothetical protein
MSEACGDLFANGQAGVANIVSYPIGFHLLSRFTSNTLKPANTAGPWIPKTSPGHAIAAIDIKELTSAPSIRTRSQSFLCFIRDVTYGGSISYWKESVCGDLRPADAQRCGSCR